MMDLFYAPLYIPRTFYHIVYDIRMERYHEEKRKKEEEEKKEKEEARREEIRKRDKRLASKLSTKRLSPAAQAREAKHSSQVDARSEDKKQDFTAKPVSPHSNLDLEEMIDILEEGG